MSLETWIKIIGWLSFACGIMSVVKYVYLAASMERFGYKVKYTGRKFWILALVCLIALYLKS